MPELLLVYPELPLLVTVCVAAVLWRWVRRWLAGLVIGVVVAIVVGVFLHEAWEAGTFGNPPAVTSRGRSPVWPGPGLPRRT